MPGPKRQTVKPRTRFNLLFVAVFLIGMLASGLIARQFLNQGARQETVRSALLMLESALAVRSYTIDEIQPLLSASNEHQFKPPTVPAFAATQTLRRLAEKYPDYRYREAVLNPTNPSDLAVAWERELIAQFRADASLAEIEGQIQFGTGTALYVARPIQIKNPACLACHSTPEAAPASLVQRYGRQGGFGWQLNEIVGVQVISVPMAVSQVQADRLLGIFMGMYVAIFGVLLVALNLPIGRWMAEQERRAQQLEDMQRQLKVLNQELADQSLTDTLTGLRNRRAFERLLMEQRARLERSSTSLGMLILDVDLFKSYNDSFGHIAGDHALAQVGQILQRNARANDFAVRYGGEEFAVMLPDTTLDTALKVAERFRLAVAAANWTLRPITVSVGVAVATGAEDGATLVERADQALYQAKRQGRNCVVQLTNTTG